MQGLNLCLGRRFQGGEKLKTIIFAGQGKIGEVCLEALWKEFENVDIIRAGNETICGMKRKQNRVIGDVNESLYEYVFLAGWHSVIPEEDLKKKKYINVHGSLLPKYRGLHSIFWAIMNGEDELGYTIHKVNGRIDDGDILYQYRFPYKDNTIGEIQELFYADLRKNLGHLLTDYMDGKLIPIKQNAEEATWVPRRNLEDCLIDFHMPIVLMRRYFKALTAPYPQPRLQYKGKDYEVAESRLIERNYYCQEGRIVNCDDNGVWVKINGGLLVVVSIRDTDTGDIVPANTVMKTGYRFIG